VGRGGLRDILRNIEANGGNGLVNYTPPGTAKSYQLVILGKQVVAVTLEGEYQPRMVAEKVVSQFVSGEGEAEWVPFPAYYPPLHLMFFLPFWQKAEEGEKGKGRGGKK
jgi:hypothetical protein